MNTFPGFFKTEGQSPFTNSILGDLKYLAQILIREAVLLGLNECCVRRQASLAGHQRFFFLNQLLHLFNEIVLNLCQFMNLLNRRPLPERLIHDKMTLTGSRNQ